MNETAGTSTQQVGEGITLGGLLSADIHPVLGILMIMLGIGLCLMGYFVYRLTVALSAGVAGGALVYILGPTVVSLQGTSLLTTAGGAAMVLLVLGSFFYRVSIFAVGAATGFALGIGMWVVASGDVGDVGGITDLTLGTGDTVQIIIASILPAAAIGLVMVKWERRLMTLTAVLLGAGLIALGFRYSGLPDVIRAWSPIVAGAAMAAGFYQSIRRDEESDDND